MESKGNGYARELARGEGVGGWIGGLSDPKNGFQIICVIHHQSYGLHKA